MTERTRVAGRRQLMATIGRRSVLSGSVGLAAAATLPLPYIARAANKTATVWWVQGFVPQEDAAFRAMVSDYEKGSGNKIEYSIMPFTALAQKTISAVTTGEVPDVGYWFIITITPQVAWDDRLTDVTDVVESQQSQYSPTALLCARFYNHARKERSFYFVPLGLGCVPFHVWGSLVEQAGYKMQDIPKTWDAFFDFFKPVHKALRSQGMRKTYGLGLQLTTIGPGDGNLLFQGFLIANGGKDIVTKDGKLHTDDPAIREAAIKATTYLTTAYKEGYVPPEVLSWNDADDNNAFHAKRIVMDYDGSISTEIAVIDNKQQYYNEILTLGLPNGNDGQPVPAQLIVPGCFIPKGAKNADVARDFLKYLIQPQIVNAYLKAGLGRWVPAMPSLVNQDPFWLDPTDPHRAPYVRQSLLGLNMPDYPAFNPAWGQFNAEQLWGQAEADVIKNGLSPAAAIDKAFRRAEAIFARYPIVQS
jgi:multiple sugar transport system substrate-binding protein